MPLKEDHDNKQAWSFTSVKPEIKTTLKIKYLLTSEHSIDLIGITSWW